MIKKDKTELELGENRADRWPGTLCYEHGTCLGTIGSDIHRTTGEPQGRGREEPHGPDQGAIRDEGGGESYHVTRRDGAPGDPPLRRFYIRLGLHPLDRSFVLNSNSISIHRYSSTCNNYLDIVTSLSQEPQT
jgi:hypothetical protein